MGKSVPEPRPPRVLPDEVRETPPIQVRRVRKDILYDERHALLTVSSIGEPPSTPSSLSMSRASASLRLPGSKGSPGTLSHDGSTRPPAFAVSSTKDGLPDSRSRSFRRMKYAPSPAVRHDPCGFSRPSKCGLGSGRRRMPPVVAQRRRYPLDERRTSGRRLAEHEALRRDR